MRLIKSPQSDRYTCVVSLCTRYAPPRCKTVIHSAVYGSFENELLRMSPTIPELVDVGSITIQATGRLCNGRFSEDPAPGKVRRYAWSILRRRGKECASARERLCSLERGHPAASRDGKPIKMRMIAPQAREAAIFKVLIALGNDQALAVGAAASTQTPMPHCVKPPSVRWPIGGRPKRSRMPQILRRTRRATA